MFLHSHIQWNYRTWIKFRTEPNSVDLIWFCHGKPYPNFVFLTVFMAYLVSGPKSTPDFPGLLLVCVLIMTDKVILDHKMSYLVYFENFYFLWFFHLWPIFAENENFQNRPKMTFYGPKWLYLTQFRQKITKVRGSSSSNFEFYLLNYKVFFWFIWSLGDS